MAHKSLSIYRNHLGGYYLPLSRRKPLQAGFYMAMKALQMLCILFLLFSASLIFPSAEGLRTLEESKDGISTGALDPKRPACPRGGCPARGKPYTGRSPPPPTVPPASN